MVDRSRSLPNQTSFLNDGRHVQRTSSIQIPSDQRIVTTRKFHGYAFLSARSGMSDISIRDIFSWADKSSLPKFKGIINSSRRISAGVISGFAPIIPYPSYYVSAIFWLMGRQYFCSWGYHHCEKIFLDPSSSSQDVRDVAMVQKQGHCRKRISCSNANQKEWRKQQKRTAMTMGQRSFSSP